MCAELDNVFTIILLRQAIERRGDYCFTKRMTNGAIILPILLVVQALQKRYYFSAKTRFYLLDSTAYIYGRERAFISSQSLKNVLTV